MAKILLIETSGPTLSVAIADGGHVLAERVCREPRMQASLTAPLVKEVLDAVELSVSDCDAVCVSKGPGSYTGLRVGVSTANGLAFGAGIPLLAVGTLDILAYSAIGTQDILAASVFGIGSVKVTEPVPPEAPQGQICGIGSVGFSEPIPKYVVPMIDARRMEVYTAVYGPSKAQQTTGERLMNGEQPSTGKGQLVHEQLSDGERVGWERLTDVEAKVIGPDSFAEYLAQGPVLFIGDGALKCKDVITHPNAVFRDATPLASAMAPLAEQAFNSGRFEDLAYFEPFYLKDFVAAAPKVHGL